jgi:glycosyltransferase involved in cell wall biosynthesis
MAPSAWRRAEDIGIGRVIEFPRSILIPISDFALGGTERIAIRLANAWAAKGCTVTLFCGEDIGALAGMIDRAGVRVVEAGIKRGQGSRKRLGEAAASHLTGQPADACFIPGNFHWPTIAPIAALTPRPKIVAQISAAVMKPQRQGLRRKLYEARMARLLRGADAAVTLSHQALEDAAAILPRAKLHAIPLPALENDTAPPSPASGCTIMAAGRLVPEKGFYDLMEAFARIDRPDARLLIVGAGPDEARLRARAVELAIADRVTLPGYAPDIRPHLDASRLFVLSSHFEGYAAVLIEALAAGRPIVATDCTPATGELLTEPESGAVVPVGDPAAMALAITAMLARPAPDPHALAAKVSHFRIGPVADRYLDLFASLR